MPEIIYLNGVFQPAEQSGVAFSDRGLTLGDGVFDTLLAVNGAPLYAAAHFERLARHAAVMQIVLTQDANALTAVARELLEKNGFQHGRHTVRTMLTRGPGARGLMPPETIQPTLIMRAGIAPESKINVSAMIANIRRNEGSPLSRIKSLNYGDQILALMEARAKDADDALLLNNKEHLCCATVGSVFVVMNGECLTPPLEDGVLDGISRARVLQAGLARERSISAELLEKAEAVFICNSVAGLQRVTVLNGRAMDGAVKIENKLRAFFPLSPAGRGPG